MSMATIKDILLIDPSREPLVNNGQARLADQTDEKVVAELRGELKMFVCEGEFARGLDCILSEYLGNLGNSSQKAVWVSGFFGSGKSHLLKMLAHLWADTPFSDGATARGIVDSFSYFLANSDFTKDNPQVIVDVIDELAKVGAAAQSNLDDTVAALSEITGVPAEVTRVTLTRPVADLGGVSTITDAAIAYQQGLADEFYNLGIVPRKLTVTDIVWRPKAS